MFDSITKIHADISDLIFEGKIVNAISSLYQLIFTYNLENYKNKLLKPEETYKYLLKFFEEGWNDEQREETIINIKSDLLLINDEILREIKLKDNPGIYYSTRRYNIIRNEDLRSLIEKLKQLSDSLIASQDNTKNADLSVRKEYEQTLSTLFSYIWTKFPLDDNDLSVIKSEFQNTASGFDVKSQIISAILLGNMEYFDPASLNLLFELYDTIEDERVEARIILAIFLILNTYWKRIGVENRILNHLHLWEDSILIFSRLKEIILNFIKTKDTERVSFKVQNEVIPELMKMNPEILNKIKGFGNPENSETEGNPDWEEMLENSGLGEKLRELTELQLEGADFMMSAFANLKNYSFFKSVSNWFLPFSFENSHLINAFPVYMDNFKDLFNIEGVMCDSDKYSFALSLVGMPESQKEIISKRMSEQLGHLHEAMEEQGKKLLKPGFNREIIVFLRDLYRFFKLFDKRNEFKDPFIADANFLKIPVISEIAGDPDLISIAAEFYFKRNYFKDALSLFLELEKREVANPALWEKIGYSYQCLGENKEALIWYRKAELLNGDSQWLNRRIGHLMKANGDHQEALDYFRRLMDSSPENVSLMLNISEIYLALDQPSKALEFLYHAEYLKPEKKDIKRLIAWTEMLNKNFTKSHEYHSVILSEGEVTAEDYLNMAHLKLVTGDLKEAINHYGKSLSLEAGNFDKLLKNLQKDYDSLAKIGLDKTKFDLLVETLKLKKMKGEFIS